MKLAKGENKPRTETVRVELELDKKVAEQLQIMESHTKIPKGELATTALKRFISAHKDYFPEEHRS
jgi:hypothetical protein